MNKADWLNYPGSIPAKSNGASVQSLLHSSFINMTVVAVLTGVAILLDGLIGGVPDLQGRLPAVTFALALAILAWLISSQHHRWPVLIQRLILLILTWGIPAAVLIPVSTTHTTDPVSPIFLLSLIAATAWTIRPLLDQLLGLLTPAIGAILWHFQLISSGSAGKVILSTAFTCLIAFALASQQLRQKIHDLETLQLAAAQRRQLDELIQRDPVTELYNDIAFKSRLSIEIARSTRYQRPLSLIAFELHENNYPLRSTGRNHFETTIASLAAILNKKLRTTDILGCDTDGRFLVALPDTELVHAQIAANRIQVTIAHYNSENKTSLTFNCGISEYHGEAIEALILVTEARMREANKRGPDQIVIE